MKYIILFMLIYSTRVMACSCLMPDLFSLVSESKEIWQIEIKNIEKIPGSQMNKITYTVINPLKGNNIKSGYFVSKDNYCGGFLPKIGSKPLFFDAKDKDVVAGCGQRMRYINEPVSSYNDLEKVAVTERQNSISSSIESIEEICRGHAAERPVADCLNQFSKQKLRLCNLGPKNPSACENKW